jgi:hypothetical protein
MAEERKRMDLEGLRAPAIGVEERSDEAPSAGARTASVQPDRGWLRRTRRWGLTDQEEIDKIREGLFFEASMQNWESQMYQHEQGMLDDGMWEVRRARIRNTVVRNRNFPGWWTNEVDPEFRTMG